MNREKIERAIAYRGVALKRAEDAARAFLRRPSERAWSEKKMAEDEDKASERAMWAAVNEVEDVEGPGWYAPHEDVDEHPDDFRPSDAGRS
jgi:hypothetical protein